MKPRHAAALSLLASLAFSCLMGCATYRVGEMAVQGQGEGVAILSYKYGWFAPIGDEGQQISIATSICTTRGYAGAWTLAQSEWCLTHWWGIPYLFGACYGSVFEGSYACLDAEPFSPKDPFSI
jgi:hypothetical protein